MLIAAVLIVAIGCWGHWRGALAVAAAVAIAQWWLPHQTHGFAVPLLHTGVLLTLPFVPWSARRTQRMSETRLFAQQQTLERDIAGLRARLTTLHQEADALAGEMNQLVELYRVTKETAGDIKLAGFFEQLTTILSTTLSFNAWHLVLVTHATGDGETRIEQTWTGQVARGAILAGPVDQPPAWQLALLHSRRLAATPQWIHGATPSGPSGQPVDIASIPLVFHDQLRGIMLFEQLPEAEFLHAQIIAHQVALQLERVLLYHELERLAVSDSLTELPLRRFFLQRLHDELVRAQRHATTAALIMCDIDHFKQLNDAYGHLVGDEVLRRVGALLKANVREIDLTARYGGEEFALCLVETDAEAAHLVAERIRRMIAEQTIQAYDETVRVTISIGIAMYPAHGTAPAELLEHADQALYHAKAQGRNRVILYETAGGQL